MLIGVGLEFAIVGRVIVAFLFRLSCYARFSGSFHFLSRLNRIRIRIRYARGMVVGWFDFYMLFVLLLVNLVDIRILLASIRIQCPVYGAGRGAVAI